MYMASLGNALELALWWPILVLFFLVGLRSRPGESDRVAIYPAIFLLFCLGVL